MADQQKVIATNPNAYSNYAFEEIVEAGIILTGTEIKSIRNSAPGLREAFVEVKSQKYLEAWIVNLHIGPYSHGNIWNHEPMRRRKLLLHAHQLEKLFGGVTQKGLSIIPIRMYFKRGIVKIELGIGKGKKKYDKRETIKQKTAQREMDRAIKHRN